MAEEIADSATIQELQETAREHAIAIVAPLYERDGNDFYNTAVVLDTNGNNLGRFRKCHIPKGRNEFGQFDERFYYGPSKGGLGNAAEVPGSHELLPVFPTAVARVGVSICYDRHFEGMGVDAGNYEVPTGPPVGGFPAVVHIPPASPVLARCVDRPCSLP